MGTLVTTTFLDALLFPLWNKELLEDLKAKNVFAKMILSDKKKVEYVYANWKNIVPKNKKKKFKNLKLRVVKIGGSARERGGK